MIIFSFHNCSGVSKWSFREIRKNWNLEVLRYFWILLWKPSWTEILQSFDVSIHISRPLNGLKTSYQSRQYVVIIVKTTIKWMNVLGLYFCIPFGHVQFYKHNNIIHGISFSHGISTALWCRTIALVATVICWPYPTLNRFYLILSYLILMQVLTVLQKKSKSVYMLYSCNKPSRAKYRRSEADDALYQLVL